MRIVPIKFTELNMKYEWMRSADPIGINCLLLWQHNFSHTQWKNKTWYCIQRGQHTHTQKGKRCFGMFSPLPVGIHLIIPTGWYVESHYTSLPALLLSSAANIPPLLDFTSEHRSHPPRCASAIIRWHNPAKVAKFSLSLSLWLGWSGQLVVETKISKTQSCTSWRWRFSLSIRSSSS